jgi:Gelsolin repeat
LVWRIEKFKVVPWPTEQYGEFFRGDSYIVLNTYKVGSSDALKYDIHIWIGSESTQDEYGTAAYKMVEADDYLGGAPVQHRQVEGSEAPEFEKLFGFLEYLDGGVESGFKHVEPTVDKPLFFRVKGTHVKTLKMMQVPMTVASLNEGDSFILYASKEQVWCWHGKDVSTYAPYFAWRGDSRDGDRVPMRVSGFFLSLIYVFAASVAASDDDDDDVCGGDACACAGAAHREGRRGEVGGQNVHPRYRRDPRSRRRRRRFR